ncbi:sialate O-acetylesterase [Sphingomonas sp. 179-I 2A4 NHS]|uniref:sialate O-acetylesterase n=1 Tax=unclassified Sphingomonas TaxID=196159 RepID=UPI0038792195
MLKPALFVALALAAPSIAAAPRLDGVIGDHAVVQRDQPITVSGEIAPGESVMVALGGQVATTTSDGDGRFSVLLPALPAGGPFDLTVAAASGATVARDILVGDVFLCSGQSNMELRVDQAQALFPEARPPVDDGLRLLTVDRAVAITPQRRFARKPEWSIAGPETAQRFSAACFFMVQSLRGTATVPIGAIHASWGGSRISAWMSDRALRAAGMATQADQLTRYGRDPAGETAQAGAAWEAWWRSTSGDAPGAEPWQPSATIDWQPVPAITNFEAWGVPALADYNGMIWYQREVEVSAAQAKQPATLMLGAVDDADRTWLNGRGVGGSSQPGQQRVYSLAPGALRAGSNVLTVNVDDGYANGGMTGPAQAMRLIFADGSIIPLGDGWRYAVAQPVGGGAPRVAWDDINGAGTLFNAMIAPLAPVRLAGIAWYQGESDTDIPGYDRRLAALIADWRQRFGTARTAAGIVQLSSYGDPASTPVESGWGYIRDAQRRVAAADPHAGLAVTHDIGDPFDIHPGEKRHVGLRLARAMRAALYGKPEAPAGPAIADARLATDGSIVLRFTGVTGALHATGSDRAIGFELCELAPRTCRFASGTVHGSAITLPADGRPVTRVRYAWADVPATNLTDETPLPVGTFEVPVR